MHLDPFSGHGLVGSQGEVRPMAAPPCTTRLAFLNLLLLAQQSCCLLDFEGRGISECFLSV